MWKVEPAGPGSPEVAELHELVFGEKFPETTLRERSSLGGFGLTVHGPNGRAVGYAVGYVKEDGLAYLWMLGVDPDVRGGGAGQRLLAGVEETLRQARFQTLEVRTYQRWGSMLRMLRGRGYEEVAVKWSVKRAAQQLTFHKALR